MLGTLETGSGYWNAVVFVIVFVVIALAVYVIRCFGEKGHKKGEQAKPFLSGNPEPEKGKVHVRAGNIYWGFTESLKGYYSAMKNLHTGNLNDYIYWFIGVLAIMLLVITVSWGEL